MKRRIVKKRIHCCNERSDKGVRMYFYKPAECQLDGEECYKMTYTCKPKIRRDELINMAHNDKNLGYWLKDTGIYIPGFGLYVTSRQVKACEYW